MALIELKGVRKTYGDSRRPAVDGLTLAIARGEIVTFLGPSGCGKTTTLRMIAGLERPEKGEIYLDGRLAAGPREWIPPEKRGVGMVFQDYALFPHLTVEENAAFPLFRRAKEERRRRAREVLELVGLKEMGDRFPHQLSGGQQQRVALARALASEPVVVLLDEPFSNLDAELRNYMRQEIRAILKGTGAAAVFVSHDQKDALAISDRIVVLQEGRVEQVGTPQEIYQKPASEFVAAFLGGTNLLPGRVMEDGQVETELGVLPKNGKAVHPGQSLLVSIRPEGLEVVPGGALRGKVVSFAYGGSVSESKVLLPSGREVTLAVPAGTPLAVGEEISLAVKEQLIAYLDG